MGRFVFRLPDIGEGVTEAEIAAWHVGVGDRVEEDQALLDVLTDKATVDMSSPVRGVVIALHGEVGAARPVGSPLVELEVEGEVEVEGADAVTEPVAVAPMTPPAPPSTTNAEERSVRSEGKVLAAPAVRARAASLSVDLSILTGSGPGGRIVHADLDAVLQRSPAQRSSAAFPEQTGASAIKLVGLRRRIAEHMEIAKRSIPHFGYVEEVEVTALEALRARVNAAGENHLTLLPFFALAVIRAVRDFPQVNAVYDDQAGVIYRHEHVHLGVATQTDAGLMVPVVRNAERMSLRRLSHAIAEAALRARNGSASREELSGSTITISSLGRLGGISAAPVINHPEVAILAPNRVRDRLEMRDGALVVVKVMNVSTAFDHRIVDGHEAAAFVAQVKAYLEAPDLMLLD